MNILCLQLIIQIIAIIKHYVYTSILTLTHRHATYIDARTHARAHAQCIYIYIYICAYFYTLHIRQLVTCSNCSGYECCYKHFLLVSCNTELANYYLVHFEQSASRLCTPLICHRMHRYEIFPALEIGRCPMKLSSCVN